MWLRYGSIFFFLTVPFSLRTGIVVLEYYEHDGEWQQRGIIRPQSGAVRMGFKTWSSRFFICVFASLVALEICEVVNEP